MSSSSPANAFVTGASGFIGGHLLGRLLDDGWSVTALLRPGSQLSRQHPALRIVTGDLSQPEALRSGVRDVSVVFHCAANVSTWDSRAAYTKVNVDGTRNLLAAIREQPRAPRLVHLSSMDVYGFPPSPCSEEAPRVAAGFAYGDTKCMGEALVGELAEAGFPAVILRLGNVIGAGSPFVTRVSAALSGDGMLTIDGGRVHAGLLAVDNLVDTLLWAAQAPSALGQCYNVRDDWDIDWRSFIDAVRQGLPAPGKIHNLSFSQAEFAAKAAEAWYGRLYRDREPPLHRLIVRIFGRTCGHSIGKIQRAGGLSGRVGFADAMRQAAALLRSAP